MTESAGYLGAMGRCRSGGRPGSQRWSLGGARLTWLVALAFLIVAASAPLSAGFRTLEQTQSTYDLSETDHTIFGHSSWESRTGMRTLQQAPDSGLNGTLILAANRTARRDILKDFKVYRGGWDIRNKNYWSSTGWTGLPGFVIAAGWLLLALLLLLLLCTCCCCCRDRVKKPSVESRAPFIIGSILLFLLTVAAIGGAVWLYLGQQKFHDETSKTLNFVVDQSELVQSELRNVSSFLLDLQNKQVLNQSVVPMAQQTQLRSLSTSLRNSANDLQTKTSDNADKIQNALDWVRLALIILAAVMLGLVVLGLFFTLCGFFWVVHVLTVIGWILVAATWILVGVFLLLNNAMKDTCVAMDEWVANPTASTNLDDILPCVDPNEANQTLQQTTAVARTIANLTNSVLTGVNSPLAGRAFNASGPAVPLLNLTGPVNFTNAESVWRNNVCQVEATGTNCTTPGRLTPEVYRELVSGVQIGNNLTVYGPFLTDLQNCEFVRQTFMTITATHCPKLVKATRWIYWGLILVSGGTMLAIILWILLNHKRKALRARRKDQVRGPIYGASAPPLSRPNGNGAAPPARPDTGVHSRPDSGVVHMA